MTYEDALKKVDELEEKTGIPHRIRSLSRPGRDDVQFLVEKVYVAPPDDEVIGLPEVEEALAATGIDTSLASERFGC